MQTEKTRRRTQTKIPDYLLILYSLITFREGATIKELANLASLEEESDVLLHLDRIRRKYDLIIAYDDTEEVYSLVHGVDEKKRAQNFLKACMLMAKKNEECDLKMFDKTLAVKLFYAYLEDTEFLPSGTCNFIFDLIPDAPKPELLDGFQEKIKNKYGVIADKKNEEEPEKDVNVLIYFLFGLLVMSIIAYNVAVNT